MEHIKLEDVQFPNDLKFEFTSNGFKVNSTGGEFFPNKLAGPITLSFWLILVLVVINEYLQNIVWHVNHSPGYNILFLFIHFILFVGIPYCIILAIKMLTDIDTEYTFSPSGINIDSKKGKLFISKDNISDVYFKDEKVQMRNSYYIKYCVYLKFYSPSILHS